MAVEEGVHITFDEKQLRILVAEHLLGKMTDESKTSIIAKALQYLLEPAGYGNKDGPTKLQEAFNKSMAEVLKNMAEEWFQEPEMQEKIAELMHEAAELVFVKRRETVVGDMAEGMAEKLKSRGW